MKYFYSVILVFFTLSSIAQKQKKADIDAILSMCGCYDISFNFAETFASSKDYEFRPNYQSAGLEWVFPVEQTKDKIVLQHLLIVNDTMIIKHWRQDWLFENRSLYSYHLDNTWYYEELPAEQVKGQWTQKVFQVDDSPRYEGSGSWVHVDGKKYWESTADSPLPRREFSKRDDYNLMVRTNRHEITEYGWLHEQDNDKVIRTTAGDERIASEKGWNTYSKVESSKCDPAKKWWNEQSVYWADVRDVWAEIFDEQEDIKLQIRKGNDILFMRLFGLGDELTTAPDYSSELAREKILTIINEHRMMDETADALASE